MTYISLYGTGDTSTLWFFLFLILALGAVCAVFGIIIYLSMVFCCKKKFDDDYENDRFKKDERAETRLIEYNLKAIRESKNSEIELSEFERSKSSKRSRGKTPIKDSKRQPLIERDNARSRTPTRATREPNVVQSRLTTGGEQIRFLSQAPEPSSSRVLSRTSSSVAGSTSKEEISYVETIEERDGRLVKVTKKIIKRKKPKLDKDRGQGN